jgi:hypothetical protein
MVQTHQHSREKGTTTPLPPQEAEKIWHGISEPQKDTHIHTLHMLTHTQIHIDATHTINQSNVFLMPFLHQPMSQSDKQKPSLKPQTASNADVEAQWLFKSP